MFGASFLPLPAPLGIDREHRWAGNSRSFCKILKGEEEQGHFHQWNEDDAAECWLAAREDRCTVHTLPCPLPAHWQRPSLFIQRAQALHTEHSSSHTPGLVPGRFSCLWMASLQSWKHYLDFKTFYHVKDIFLNPRKCIIFPWISEQSRLCPVWNVMWGSVTSVKIQH